jgi:hypothetical protein
MTPLEGAGDTEVLLFATGLDLVQPTSDINCARLEWEKMSATSVPIFGLSNQIMYEQPRFSAL